jgi:integrase
MASLCKDKNGWYSVQFYTGSTKRSKITLGTKNERTAGRTLEKIELLIRAKQFGQALEADSLAWLQKISGTELEVKLKKANLLLGGPLTGSPEAIRANAPCLGDFLAGYIEMRKGLKLWTIKNMKTAGNLLIAFFGKDKKVSEITPADGETFFHHLTGKGYAKATISRAMRRAITFFKFAQKSQFVLDNPFQGIKLPKQTNKSRMAFIDRTTIDKLLDQCPDTFWRLVISLARYGGLRIPSELLGLTWDCVDWAAGKLKVTSPKTEHNEGGEFRWIPLFPEIKIYLEEAWEAAAEGEKHIFPALRDQGVNLRQGLSRIIEKAGLPQWPKLFTNLRSSRATELANRFPQRAISDWLGAASLSLGGESQNALAESASIMGHTPKVSHEHYQQTLDIHWQMACADPSTESVSGAQIDGANNGAVEVFKAVPQGRAARSKKNADTTQPNDGIKLMPSIAGGCEMLQNDLMPRVGIEPTTS